jgi:lipopolysaccharide transport system ATP-binding protein
MINKHPVISVRNISKVYPHIGRNQKLVGKQGQTKRDFFALKNISFEVYEGDILGVIGPNGSGKSTLLKILGEITQPTSGQVEIIGKLTSIVDIGTGFHPDLSGRENIFLSGSMLGLSKKEIEMRLDAIVSFSGIGDFLEMPVKNYSSGMYLRLAFSVAFHTDIDILLLDEVIAVGDAKFRNRSFKKIKELAANGKTIILVSHNMDQIKQFANRCIYLDKGEIASMGSFGEVVKAYLSPQEKEKQPNQYVHPQGLEIKQVGIVMANPNNGLTTADDIVIRMELNKLDGDVPHQITVVLKEITGAKVLTDSFALKADQANLIKDEGCYVVTVKIEGGLLNYGVYSYDLIFTQDYGIGTITHLSDMGYFELKHADEDLTKKYKWTIDSPISKRLDWTIKHIE